MSTPAMRDLAIVACAVSAGIHAALTPEHFDEGAGPGGGFLVATVLLAVLAVALTVWPDSVVAATATALVFAGLLVAYALVVTTGVPVLHPEVEPVEGLALWTKLVEVVGLLAAVGLARRPRAAIASRLTNLRGVTQ